MISPGRIAEIDRIIKATIQREETKAHVKKQEDKQRSHLEGCSGGPMLCTSRHA